MIKIKTKKYLLSKKESTLSHLDKLLKMYLDGSLKKMLAGYDEIRIYPEFSKKHGRELKNIRICYMFQNISVILDFLEDHYKYFVYREGKNLENYDKLCSLCEYSENFEFKTVIDKIDVEIKNHPKLKNITLLKKRQAIYAIIAKILLCFPFVINAFAIAFEPVTKIAIAADIWWISFTILLPILLSIIFNDKANRFIY